MLDCHFTKKRNIFEIQGGSDLEHILTYGQLKLPESRSAIFTRITIINCIWNIIRSFTLLAFRWLIPESSEGLSWSWSYCSCIYNYLCNQCISPLTLQYYVITFVRDLQLVGGFLRVLRIHPPIILTATIKLEYCWK